MSDETPVSDELVELTVANVRGYTKVAHGKVVTVRPAMRSAPTGQPSAAQGVGGSAPRVNVTKAPVGRHPLPTAAAQAISTAAKQASADAAKAAAAQSQLTAAQAKALKQQLALQSAQQRAAANTQIQKNRVTSSNARTAAALARANASQKKTAASKKKAAAKKSSTKSASGGTGSAKAPKAPKLPRLGLLGVGGLGGGGLGGGGGLNRHPLLRHAAGLFVLGKHRGGSSKKPKSSKEKASLQKTAKKLVSPKELSAAHRALEAASAYRRAGIRGKHRTPLGFHESLSLSSTDAPEQFGDDLRDMQNGLNFMGYPVAATGIMDDSTVDSLEAYINSCLEADDGNSSDV